MRHFLPLSSQNHFSQQPFYIPSHSPYVFKGWFKIPQDIESEILERISFIESFLKKGLERIQAQLALGQDTNTFFSDALTAYKKRALKQQEDSQKQIALASLEAKFRLDKELRYPHRKILDVLISKYDFQRRKFEEVHFSRLVNEARIGKSAAKSYLRFLEARGYIEKRSDGYRAFFKVKENN